MGWVDAPIVACLRFRSVWGSVGCAVPGERQSPSSLPASGRETRATQPRWWPGSGASFGCLPIKQSGNAGAGPLRPRERTRLAELGVLRGWTAQEWVSHNNSAGHYLLALPELGMLSRHLEGQSLTSSLQQSFWRGVCWLRMTSQPCLLFFSPLREPCSCGFLCWRIFTLLLCE